MPFRFSSLKGFFLQFHETNPRMLDLSDSWFNGFARCFSFSCLEDHQSQKKQRTQTYQLEAHYSNSFQYSCNKKPSEANHPHIKYNTFFKNIQNKNQTKQKSELETAKPLHITPFLQPPKRLHPEGHRLKVISTGVQLARPRHPRRSKVHGGKHRGFSSPQHLVLAIKKQVFIIIFWGGPKVAIAKDL